jgi:hypothetical protein
MKTDDFGQGVKQLLQAGSEGSSGAVIPVFFPTLRGSLDQYEGKSTRILRCIKRQGSCTLTSPTSRADYVNSTA